MEKFFIILTLFFVSTAVYADTALIQDADLSSGGAQVFTEKNKFGLKNDDGTVLIKPTFKKLIKIGDSAWICQRNNNKFGLIDKNGTFLVAPKYQYADRVFGRYAKLGNGKDYGLYNDKGHAVVPPEYSSIEPMKGGMFLTSKDYKYGIVSTEGTVLLENKFDSIYSPERGKIRVKFEGQWYELNEVSKGHIGLPEDILKAGGREFTITKIVSNPAAASGYSAVTATNYFLKVFSALSPSYEKTIDDLVYSQGADAVGVLMNLSWISKFPYTYAKNYYSNLTAPNNGPLNDMRYNLKNQVFMD